MTAHIVILVQNLPVPLDRRVWLESRALVEAGYRVSVICPKGPGDPAFETREGVELHKYDPRPSARSVIGFAREYSTAMLRTALILRRLARKGPIDAIQGCNPPDLFFLFGLVLRASGTRFVYDQHDLCPEVYASRFQPPRRIFQRLLRRLEAASYRTADHVIVCNESFRRIAAARGGRAGNDVTVVRSGPPLAELRRGTPELDLLRGRQFLCAYLGIMGPQDGVALLLDAAYRLINVGGRRDIQFAFLGFGDCLSDLRRRCTELGLDDFVTFTGMANDALIIRYLSTAHLGLCPDPRNPMNDLSTTNKILEYMAFSLPIVTFDLTEARVSAGSAAYYAPANDLDEFVSGVEELLSDPQRRAAMGAEGRARIENGLAWDFSAKGYIDAYDRLLGIARRQSGTFRTGADAFKAG